MDVLCCTTWGQLTSRCHIILHGVSAVGVIVQRTPDEMLLHALAMT